MKMKGFWDKIPNWLLNAGWIGQGALLALQQVHKFLMESAYAYLLLIGTIVSIWGLYRKNRLQIRREEIALLRDQMALNDDKLHREEIQAIKRDREKKKGKLN